MGTPRNEPYIFSLPTPSSAMCLAGIREENLKLLAEETGVRLVMRGQDLLIDGTAEQIGLVEQIIKALKPLWSNEKNIAAVDIRAARQAVADERSTEWSDRATISRNRRGDSIQPRTYRQQQYVRAMESYDLIFGVGPAGTGKTYLAAVAAVSALQSGKFERIILTRPAVEAGENLGFLPGDLQQKIDPYLRPLYDAMHEMIGAEKVPQLMERGIIEVAPLAYMRGRTLSNSFIIVDEAQNTTAAQMKMVLTRIGFKSRMVVTGDITQIDLPRHQKSGLIIAMNILKEVQGVSFNLFDKSDVVRHPLVHNIIAAYETAEGELDVVRNATSN
ncbi:MAG: phosphate starvation-inducible protein PhoH [Pseudanabaena frigida]|uniref:PhoH-like protein n=1 Tax=Pseudanabaena frigida TaxID=945775 RepID=A0A2W4WH49_9CYAN|nr:MAG: phosphate starvation-inducible protein PhoH [Pseudanabaena frigida]